jgi:chromosome segregation ATPase
MSECNDPDHGAINAERQETRGLRRAWIELDDKRQYLEKQLREVTKQRDALAEALEELERTAGQSTLWDDPARHNARKALAAVKGGSHE